MPEIDAKQIDKDVETLAEGLLDQFAQQGKDDARAFLAEAQADLISLAQDRASGEISDAEFQNSLLTVRALAKMNAIKQAGVAQVKVEQFISGVVNIAIKAAVAAI